MAESSASELTGSCPIPKDLHGERESLAKQGDSSADGGASAPWEGTAPPENLELDPLGRALAQQAFALRSTEVQSSTPAATSSSSPPLDRLVEKLLRRFALSASKGRGVAHMELGDAALGGGRLTIEAEGRAVRIVVEQDGGCDAATERWAKQLEQRLQARGLETEVELR